MRKLPSNVSAPLSVMFLALSTSAMGVTLPSRMPAFIKNSEAVDPGLDRWIQLHIDVRPVAELNSQQVLQRAANEDNVLRALILLDYQESQKNKARRPDKKLAKFDKDLQAAQSKLLAEMPNIIASELEKLRGEATFSLQQLFMAWKSIDKDAAEKSQLESKLFGSSALTSCAAKAHALDAIDKEQLEKMTPDDLAKTVKVAASYQSTIHRRRYLEALASSLPDARRAETVAQIRELARDMPIMFQRYPWLQDSESKDLPQNLIFAEAMRGVRKKQCHEAEKSFERVLTDSKTKIEPTTALETGSDIDRCYRAERRSASLEFWKRMEPKFEERFGKSGDLWVMVRVGYLKWAAGDLPESAKIYDEILRATKNSPDLKPIEAKAIYVMGKIAEDRGELDEANKYLADYVARFPEAEDYEFALNSLVVNFAAQKKWADVVMPLERYLAHQSLIHMDRRSVSLMAFSLFWLGRAKLELGDNDMAMEMWRRLAAEYYSTFYGAMGHYLLEQSSGKSYAIEPARTTGFEFSKLEATMSDENRRASQRAVTFLRVGLPERARCEAEEVVAKSADDYDTMLVRTLLLHAGGGWLDAIKVYDAIPRSVRNGLPIGFERVLFPRKYEDIVKASASKLDVDPDFVFALMRQESVFSKDAMSPVGALGLMQLMPSTARLELSKLSGDYLDPGERRELAGMLSHENGLRDPKVNVTLGVHHLWRLMQMYKSPVFALTAYNASPAATQKWQKTIATDDWLTFIERIPYKETRAYVKLILRNYFYYKRWYNSPDGKRQIHIDSVVGNVVALAKGPTIEDSH